jgi:hypothetical protein
MGITIFFTLVTPLELEAPTATLELNAPAGTRVVVTATAAGCATVFLLCFNGLAEATSTADGHFRLAFPRDGTIFTASIFFYHRLQAFAWVLPSGIKFPFLHSLGKFISIRHGTRPIGHPRMLKNVVQSTSITYVRKASIVLRLSIAANNAFGFQLNPH